jgi:SAM-dependent methyltransferase
VDRLEFVKAKMYEKIKRVLQSLLPRGFLVEHEPAFRFFYYQFYRGERFQCNICGKRLRKFIPMKNGDRLCPYCGSMSRNRRLWQILTTEFLAGRPRILDFSPSRCLYRAFKRQPGIDYTASDYSGQFLADRRLDITDIDEADDSADAVICYHVLEHVGDDQKAIRELYRILKKGGRALIQTPFKEGDMDEDTGAVPPPDRMRRFGQSDHVRMYSVSGLRDRLAANGFEVTVREFSEKSGNKTGFEEKEYVFSAKK